LGGAC
jgi:hypothetical protein